jgi:hypothetical protein
LRIEDSSSTLESKAAMLAQTQNGYRPTMHTKLPGASLLAASVLSGCVQTAFLRVENHSRHAVTVWGPHTMDTAKHFGVPIAANHMTCYSVGPGRTGDVPYHTRRITGVPLPLVGGIYSDTCLGIGVIIYHGQHRLDLPSDDQWSESDHWYSRGLCYRTAHGQLGILIVADNAQETVIVTPGGQRLPVKRLRSD